MDFGLFQEKLRELHPQLYVDVNHRIYSLNPLGTSGIYLRRMRGESLLEGIGNFQKEIRQYNQTADKYVTWVTHQWVPEGDKFKGKRCIAMGWRTIVKNL